MLNHYFSNTAQLPLSSRCEEPNLGNCPADFYALSSEVPIPNYRPISLLFVVSKMLECHVCHLLTQHMSSDHPLANSQWGFQSGESTVTALLTTTYDWFEELESGSAFFFFF